MTTFSVMTTIWVLTSDNSLRILFQEKRNPDSGLRFSVYMGRCRDSLTQKKSYVFYAALRYAGVGGLAPSHTRNERSTNFLEFFISAWRLLF